MTNEQRIHQAANEHAKNAAFNNSREDCSYCMQDFIAGAEHEAAHWQPIIAQKDAAIKELVEGLEDALGSIDEEFYPNARERIKQLIAKHKKQ